MSIRLVLAEDSYLVREGVARLLERQDDLDVVATCDDYDSLLAAVEAHRPDVVLTDIRMPPTGTDEGIRAAEAIRVRAEHHDDGGPGAGAGGATHRRVTLRTTVAGAIRRHAGLRGCR